MSGKYTLLPLFDTVENISEPPEPNGDIAFWQSDYRNGLAFNQNDQKYAFQNNEL